MKTAQRGLICLLISAGLWVCRKADLPPLQDPAADFPVYSAIIDQHCASAANPPQLLLISRQTVQPFQIDWAEALQYSQPDSLPKAAGWTAFLNTLDSSRFAIRPLTGTIPSACYQVTILTEQQQTYYATRGTEAMRQDFNNFRAVLTFSSVAYNPGRTKAVCYRAYVCGGLCGMGEMYFLEQKPGGWKVVARSVLWIA